MIFMHEVWITPIRHLRALVLLLCQSFEIVSYTIHCFVYVRMDLETHYDMQIILSANPV